jgi:hypothetical protein
MGTKTTKAKSVPRSRSIELKRLNSQNMKHIYTFESFLNESSDLNEGLDAKKVEKLLDDMYAQDQKVKDSNYSMAEIKKMDAIEREAVKMGLAKKLGSAWDKDKTPKEVHSKYEKYGYSWYGE